MLRASGSVATPISGNPISGFTAITNIFTQDITFAAGAITALTGTVSTQSVPGLLTTDNVVVNCTGLMTAGAGIVNARVSSADNLAITFTTAVAVGVTLPSLTYRVTVFR